MHSHLANLFKKELREIFRDPRLFIGMIIVPLLMFPLMGSAIRVSTEASEKQLAGLEIGLYNTDSDIGNASLSKAFYSIMLANKVNVHNITAATVQGAIDKCRAEGVSTLIYLPANFTQSIKAGRSADIYIYQFLKRYDIAEMQGAQKSVSIVATFNDAVTYGRLAEIYQNSTAKDLLVPANAVSRSIIRGQASDADPANVVGTLMSTSISMPIVIMLLIIMAGQLAATSVAMEKEQKTLEVLLTLPIRRINILLGKIAGVVVVSIVATLAYVVGFSYYMGSFSGATAGRAVDLSSVGLVPEAAGLALLTGSLFLAFLSALSLSVMLAAYTKDVRSAQSLMGILYLPIIMPAFILMFAPLEILPPAMQAIIYGIPFTYPILAAKAVYTHEYLVVGLGIVYQLVFTAVVLLIAAKFYESERVLTAKFDLGKKKKQIQD